MLTGCGVGYFSLKLAPKVSAYPAGAVSDHVDRLTVLGLEGLIGKRVGSRYEAGKRASSVMNASQSGVLALRLQPEEYHDAWLSGDAEKEILVPYQQSD